MEDFLGFSHEGTKKTLFKHESVVQVVFFLEMLFSDADYLGFRMMTSHIVSGIEQREVLFGLHIFLNSTFECLSG